MTMSVLLIALLRIFSVAYGNEITRQGCGTTSNCFYGKACSSSVDCDYFVKFEYDSRSSSVHFAIGGKHDWIAFGLREGQVLSMDGNIGEVCKKQGSVVSILSFSTSGKSPDFKQQVGIFNVSTSLVNGGAVCRYSRTVAQPSGTNLRDLAAKWYITTAYGSNSAGGFPSQHKYGAYATSSHKVKLTKIWKIPSSTISGFEGLLLVHAITGTLAWIAFSFIGIFIARYMREAFWGKKLGGKDLWFQLHRIFMVLAMLFSLVCLATIVAKLKGWNADFAGAHAYIGIVTQILGAIQAIGGTLRPNPTSNRRWIFNTFHKSFGALALVLSGVTVLLGLKLVNISIFPIILWFVFGSLMVSGLQFFLRVAPKFHNEKDDMEMKTNDSSQDQDPTSKNGQILRICFGVVIIAVSSITISLIALLGMDSKGHSH